MSDAARLLPVGTLFRDRYRVDSMLGEGGHGAVFGATDVTTERQVAIKLLKSGDADLVTRFRREAQVLGQLSNPHTVQLFDFGTTDDGQLFMISEYVPGEDLARVLARMPRLREDIVVHIALQLVSALGEAHDRGLLHRDLKPANIRIHERDGDPWRAKLLDFGIARVESSELTRTNELIGTPRYMSPEQLRGHKLTPASDIYSLGVVMYEMLAGPDAIWGNSLADQLERLVGDRILIPADVSPALGAVLKRMTALAPTARFQNMREVHAALTRPAAVTTLSTGPVATRTHLAVGAAIAAVVVGALAAYAVFGRDEQPREVPQRMRDPGILAKAEPHQPVPTPSTRVDVGTMDLGTDEPTGCGREWPVGHQEFDWRAYTGRHRWPLRIPEGYDPNVPHPLVFLFHSSSQSAMEVLTESGMIEFANERGILLVAPEQPNSTKGALFHDEAAWRPDDVGNYATELREAVDAAREHLCVDPQRIFAIGSGTGAFAAETMRCDPNVRAVAMVAGRADRPICVDPAPLVHIALTEDCYYPIDAADRCTRWFHNPGLAEFEAAFRVANACGEEQQRHSETCHTWAGCEAPLVTCIAPGGPVWGRKLENREFTPSKYPIRETIWEFFLAQVPR